MKYSLAIKLSEVTVDVVEQADRYVTPLRHEPTKRCVGQAKKLGRHMVMKYCVAEPRRTRGVAFDEGVEFLTRPGGPFKDEVGEERTDVLRGMTAARSVEVDEKPTGAPDHELAAVQITME